MRVLTQIVTLTVLVGAAVPAEAATYYVDAAHGNDANPGTSTAPWKTLGRAKINYSGSPKVAYGDTVLVRNGSYGGFSLDGSVFPLWEGDNADPLPESQQWVTYKAEPGQTEVHLSGIYLNLGNDLRVVAHVFDGFKIIRPGGDGIYTRAAMGVKLKNMVFEGITDTDVLYAETSAHNNMEFAYRNAEIHIDNCDISYGYRGVFFGGYNCNWSVTNCNIHSVGTDKIICGGGVNILIENNRIHGNSLLPTEHPDCIQFYTAANRYPGSSADNVTIRGNRLYDHSSQGIWTGGSILRNVIFENNLIYNTGNYEWRVYGVYGGIIRNNTIVGDDLGNTGIVIYGGTFTENEGTLDGYPRNQDITVVNNVFATSYSGDASVMTYHDHNIYVKPWNGSPGDNEAHSYGYDSIDAAVAALFRDPAARDYRLKDGALGVDFGTVAAGIYPTDLLGNPREGTPDAGCFETGTGSANQAPSLDPIADRQIAAGQTLTLAITGTDADGDSLSFSASGLPSGATFADATLAWTPTDGQVGTYHLAFEVTDGQFYDSETITITVEGSGVEVNNQPTLAAIGDKAVNENVLLSFSVSASDPDGDPITYSTGSLPGGASFSDQSFAWTPTYDQSSVYQVTFTASDGNSQATETITITVANVNRAPVLTGVGDKSVDESSPLTFAVAAADPDGDALTYSAGGLPSGATFVDGGFSWTPASNQIGAYDVTFAVSDGDLQDSESITLYVVGTGPDTTAPTVTRCNPEPDAIQVVTNNLITLHVTDSGHGVDAGSVVVQVDGNIVFQGDVDVYTSETGTCTRSGTWGDYRFIYQQDAPFGFDHTVTVTVSATDRAGNVLNGHSHSFTTEMRAFGGNQLVSDGTGPKGHPATVADATGNIWAVWETGLDGDRDVYVAMMAAQTNDFAPSVALATGAGDQCNPDIALASDGQLYTVWQDNSGGNWDIYLATSSDGTTWSRPELLTDSDDNQTQPAITIDGESPSRVYVAWQDDRHGGADVYLASSTNAFTESTTLRLTPDGSDQLDPDIAVDGLDVAYVVWTDMRNGQADLYGVASSDSGWLNVPIVSTSGAQTSPALAAEPSTSVLHLLWVDDAPGHRDIYYASCDGLPANPLVGTSIIDDTSGADQLGPAIACGGKLNVFACWQDLRHSTDTDLFLAEIGQGSAKTNILIGDNSTNTDQGEPAVGIDSHGNPYVIWTDSRSMETEIYYAATTFINPVPLDSKLVIASEGAMIGPDPSTIDEPSDVSLIVPPGACQSDVRITIAEILNPQAMPVECLGSYDFGPSGIGFDEPVTVTIPYRFNGDGNSATPYWYDSLTGALSTQGITDIQNIVVAADLNALQFKTTHFTPFYLMAAEVETADSSDSESSGACSVSPTGTGSPKELLVPYGLIAVVMIALRRWDRGKRRCFRTTQG
ncbi:MAG: right-handed parallel beta-helix repeat-containing protein [Phycisphaerales bacterium]|nr:MAG: right-handed parallel beta-helix repeat-containing protein [Phycisphaerales bacterium]